MKKISACGQAILGLCLGLCLVLTAAPARAQAADPRTVEAVKALQGKDSQLAFELYSELVRDYPDDDAINFNYGQAAFATGRYPLALFAYERVLMRNPQADRVRLELGRTYLMMGQNHNAREEFQTVLSHNPPASVRTNVETLLAVMSDRDKRYRLGGQVSVGYIFDDNVNTGLIDDTISTIIGQLSVDPGSQPRYDTARFGALGLNLDYKLDEDGVWVASLGGVLYQTNHDRVESTDLSYRKINAGLQRMGENVILSLPVKYEHVDYGWKNLLDIYGIEPALIWAAGQKLFLVTQAQVEYRDNLQADSFIDKDSWYYSLGEYARIFFGPESNELMIGASVFQEDAVAPKNSNQGFELLAKLSLNMQYNVRLYAQVSKRDTYYSAKPSPLAFNRRYDQQYRAMVGFSKELWIKNLLLDANVQYTRNDSNFGAYTYTRKAATIGVSYSF